MNERPMSWIAAPYLFMSEFSISIDVCVRKERLGEKDFLSEQQIDEFVVFQSQTLVSVGHFEGRKDRDVIDFSAHSIFELIRVDPLQSFFQLCSRYVTCWMHVNLRVL